MNNSINIHHSEEDLIAAYRVNIAPMSRKRMAMIPLIAAIYMMLILFADGRLPSFFKAVLIFGSILVSLMIVVALLRFLIRRFWIPRFARRIYAQQADLRIPFHWAWDDDNFYTYSQNGDTRHPWTTFHNWRRTNDIPLLYRSEVLFHFLSLKTDEARQAADDILAHLIAHNIPEKTAKKSKKS